MSMVTRAKALGAASAVALVGPALMTKFLMAAENMDPGDVKIEGNKMHVTVHSLGALAAPAAKVVVRDVAGKTLATVSTPTLKPPTDLAPKTATVALNLPAHADLKGATVTIESAGTETTQMNNTVKLP